MFDPHSHSALTALIHTGKQASTAGGRPVNPPVVRASTVLFDSTAQMRDARARRGDERLFTYGARGTPTAFALEDAVCALEGGYRTRLFPTGLAAIAMTLLAYLRPGDHVLMADCVYEPVRHLANTFLADHGIRTTFYAADGSDIETHIEPATRMIYAECPGSLVYEMCDLRRLSALAKARGMLLVADNTWGSGHQYKPLALGADVSVMAATKYLSGHSDVMMGTATATRDAWQPLSTLADSFGMTVSPDDAYLVLRGIRSLAPRLAMHQANALAVAEWLRGREEVAAVFCPALPDHPGHALWQRDCAGTNGLLSFELRDDATPATTPAAERLVDSLALFGIGASWGGFESLASLTDMRRARSVGDWSSRGAIVRLHIGLEDPRDLIADLARGFDAMAVGAA